MDWKLFAVGAVVALIGGNICWVLRKSNFNKELPAGCGMAAGILILGTGLLTVGFSFVFKI